MMFDAHNHLQDEWLTPHLDRLIERLEQEGIAGAIVNGTHPDDWDAVAALGERIHWVRTSYGVHPWDCGRRPADWREQLEVRLQQDPAAAVGEIGLDRWILDSARPDDPRLRDTVRAPLAEQTQVFREQLALAARHERPVTIHCLQAWGPLLEVLEAQPRLPRGFLLHAYGGSAELAKRMVTLGASFSFNPSFLAERKQRQRDVFKLLPLDRLLVETDAPATPPPPEHDADPLPPSSDGSRINSPLNLKVAYAGLAELRGVTVEELQQKVADNFHRLFG